MDRTQQAAWRDFERFVRWTIEEERPAADAFLPDGERESFLSYYRNLPEPGDEPAIKRFLRGMWRGEAGWVARWLHARAAEARGANGANGASATPMLKLVNGSEAAAAAPSATPAPRAGTVIEGHRSGPPRVMDAGSGFGTYSMLYAAMGAEVTGADLRPDRLSAAERRLPFYRERAQRTLDIRYCRLDLTRPWPQDYDLVWVHNALSHIDPLDAFFDRLVDHLRPGGLFVVGDINGEKPEHLERLESLRTEVHQEYVAPDGERYAYAVERPFGPAELRTLAEEKGLTIVHHELYWGGLGVLPDMVYEGVLEPLQMQWWLGRRFARRQLFVAAA